eukprot:m.24094 g.24094  ORF g.24094 m.24094 type:complete len:68 (+) comp28567_c0_seq1:257-460(+)
MDYCIFTFYELIVCACAIKQTINHYLAICACQCKNVKTSRAQDVFQEDSGIPRLLPYLDFQVKGVKR